MKRPEIRDYITIDGVVIGYIMQEQPGRWRSYYDWRLADHVTWWSTRESARRNLIDRFRRTQSLPPMKVHR